ncbi:MAG: hypothetical protein V8S74_02790 [Lachnospirales bacterium]
MTYIENIFICLAIPPLLSLFFTKGHTRCFMLFLVIGMGICLLSAYISSFFMGYYGVNTTVTVVNYTCLRGINEATSIAVIFFNI